jgi:hypothetical protein
MSKLLVGLMLLFSTFLSADVVGMVQSVKGSVKVKSEGSFKKSRVKSGMELNSGDLVTTSRNGAVIIKLKDKSVITLASNAILQINSQNEIDQQQGKILYHVTSRDAKNHLKIKTSFAIIGIKGTTFVLDASKNASLTLKEGLVSVTSIKEKFELYRKKVQEEFNNYVSSQQSAFEQYKNAQNRYAIAEPTKKFDLKAGNRISFNGKKVNEDAWSKQDDKEFEEFKKLANSMGE